MSDIRKVPTLTSDNFISEAVLKLDTLYAYFLASDYSQSNYYRGNITSLKYLVQANGNDIDGLVSDVISSLDTYLKRYFTEVDIHAEVSSTNVISVSIRVVDSEGVATTLDSALNVVNGKLDTYSAIQSMLLK